MWDPNTNKTVSTILKEWTTPDFRNTPSTTNLEEKEIVDALGNDGNMSMPEQVNRPNPWRKMMMMNKSVETIHEGKAITLRNQQLRTDRKIHNNKPDIIIRDNWKGT